MSYLWKEWKEQSRSSGLWLSLSMIVLLTIAIMIQSKELPAEQGFEVFLLSLYDMHVYFIPLLCLFLSSFSIIQEKELKTLMMVLVKRESVRGFLFKKSFSIQLIILSVFFIWYLLMAIPTKLFFQFHSGHFLAFIATIFVFIIIFNQIGIFLGSICNTRMQLVGANIFTWFFFIFFIDFLFLSQLPSITFENIKVFSVLYFLDPLHTLRMFLEEALGLFSLQYMSRLMEKLVFLSPRKFLLLDLLIWVGVFFEAAVRFHQKGENL